MNRLTKVESSSVLIKDGWKKKDTESYTSICYGCEEIGRCVNKCGFYKALEKLAAYEDTGLEPEEVEQYKIFEDGLVLKYGCTLQQTLNLLELYKQGLLIKMPCKVKDTVYVDVMTFGTNDDIAYAEAEVISIRITKKQTFLKLRIFALGLDGMPYGCKNYSISSIGKTVFLTREEAEKALKNVKENSI